MSLSSVETIEGFKLLHLSDLHFGLDGQDWMWPTFKNRLYADLQSLHRRTGPWDVVIFSGDLTQSGSKEEFEKLTVALEELWENFKTFGSNPTLVVVPGNHDLERPEKVDPVGKLITHWWSDADVRKDFWENEKSVYKKTVSGWFSNFENWYSQISRKICTPPLTKGLLPGDISVTLEKKSCRLGIVGLNTAWLQSASGDFKGRLCIHPRQLMALTGNDPDAWCANHTSSLLVTHHPTDWLHPEVLLNWEAEIFTSGRFDAHIYGHMHDSRAKSEAISGGRTRISIQAASLFGLEYFGTEKETRDHGYSVIQLPVKAGFRGLRLWPRVLIKRADGSTQIGVDQDWTLVDDFYSDLLISEGSRMPLAELPSENNALGLIANPKNILAALVKSVAFSEAHSVVRKAEQTLFLAALRETRQAWLVTDWGLGGPEFIQCVQQQLLGRRGIVYGIDLHNYRSKEDVLQGLPEQIGCSLAGLSRSLAEAGQVILVLDDVEIDSSSSLGGEGATIGQEIDALVQVILDFCPELAVVVQSRTAPKATSMQIVELRPLDEADTAQYVMAHQNGEFTAEYDDVLRLHRHTDGFPSRIDSTLRDLQIVGLKGLFELDADVAGKHAETHEAHPALVRAVDELASAEEDADIRSFALLKVLSMFPQGEQFSRVKRFFGARAFYPSHVSRLMDLALVDAVAISTLSEQNALSENGRALVVRRPVRAYVIQLLSDAEHRTLSAKALSLYFGSNWEMRGIETPVDLKFQDSRCDMREIANACTMVFRATREATESGDAAKMRSVLALANSFAAKLRVGHHFRSIASLYDDVLPLHEGFNADLDLVYARVQHAKALRMVGERIRARDILRECEGSVKTNALKQDVFLNLAFISEALREPSSDTVKLAREAEKIDPNSTHGLQAKGIAIANGDHDVGDRDNQLRQLQDQAKKRKAFIISSNLGINRAASSSDPLLRKRLLGEAMETAQKAKDSYNFVRASLKLARIELQETGRLERGQITRCTLAYEYLYNQRIDGLFVDCHSILWDAFEANGEGDNLLNLFRYSSLVWRLRGQVDTEREYIERLFRVVGKQAALGVFGADQKMLYFMARSIQLSKDVNALLIVNDSEV